MLSRHSRNNIISRYSDLLVCGDKLGSNMSISDTTHRLLTSLTIYRFTLNPARKLPLSDEQDQAKVHLGAYFWGCTSPPPAKSPTMDFCSVRSTIRMCAPSLALYYKTSVSLAAQFDRILRLIFPISALSKRYGPLQSQICTMTLCACPWAMRRLSQKTGKRSPADNASAWHLRVPWYGNRPFSYSMRRPVRLMWKPSQ